MTRSSKRGGAARPRTVAFVTAALIEALGFLVLLALWLSRDWPTTLGLFDYRSATLGDAVLLPVLGGAIAYGVTRLPASPRELGVTAVAFLLGAMLGVAVTLQQLSDAHPTLNWTFPARNQLNPAGIYHAIFLTMATGLFVAGMAVLLLRMRNLPDPFSTDRDAQRVFVAILVSLMSFGLLLSLDNLEHTGSGAALQSLLGFLIVVSGLATIMLTERIFAPRQLTEMVIFSATAAFGLAGMTRLSSATPGAVVIAGLPVCVLSAIAVMPSMRPSHWSRGVKAGAVSLFLVGLLTTTSVLSLRHDPTMLPILSFGAAWLLLVLVSEQSQDEGGTTLRTLAGVSYPIINTQVALWVWGITTPSIEELEKIQLAVLLSFTAFAISALVVKKTFNELAEQDLRYQEARSGTQDSQSVWQQVGGFSLSAFISLGLLIVAASSALNLDPVDAVAGTSNTRLTVGAVVAIVLGLSACASCRTGKDQTRVFPLGQSVKLPRLTVALHSASFLAWAAVAVSLSEPRHMAVASIIGVVTAIAVADSVLSSCLRLQGLRPGVQGWTLAILAALSSGAALTWLISTGIRRDGVPVRAIDSIYSTGMVLVVSGALVVLASWSLWTRSGTLRLTKDQPVTNVLQDQSLYSAVLLIGCVTPVFLTGRSFEAIALFLPAQAGVTALYTYIARNNKRHQKAEHSLAPSEFIHRAAGRYENLLEPIVAESLPPWRELLARRVLLQNTISGLVLLSGFGWLLYYAFWVR